jgi:hypothetical protein
MEKVGGSPRVRGDVGFGLGLGGVQIVVVTVLQREKLDGIHGIDT